MATLNLKKKKFIDEDNVAKIIKIGIGFGERLNTVETNCITDFSEDKLYLKGEACYNNGYIYRAKVSTQGAWVDTRWEKVGDDITELTLDEIKTMLGLTQEQLTTLSSIILDSEVRLDKTFSSSKIYMDIQDAIDTSKAYTLAELGKLSGASYKVVTSTSDVTDEKIIYLLDNGTTFDMYIVDSGTPTKIGDTNIDLSNYYTKTEVDNDFLKKTDATSTYATKTELQDKVDKTAILSGVSDTPSDEKVLSEKATKVELDKKANDDEVVKKTDITTTIDSTSTDTQVPSAKAVYDVWGEWSAISPIKEGYVGNSNGGGVSYYKQVKNMVTVACSNVTRLIYTWNIGAIINEGGALPKPIIKIPVSIMSSNGEFYLAELDTDGYIKVKNKEIPKTETGKIYYYSFSYITDEL